MVMPSKNTVQSLAQRGQKAAAVIKKQKKEIVLTPKNREAIEAMVYEGLKRSDAAERVGLTDHALRTALTKPHVLAYLNQCMEVLRTGLRPRALHTMGELLETKNESVKFKAAEYLDGLNRGSHTVGATQVNVQVNNHQTVNVTPGYAIDLRPDHRDQIGHLGQHDDKSLELQANVPEDE
jgi:predicted DNA-binding protein (UPF0251 family)